VAAAVAIAWLSAKVHFSGRAPIGLLSIAVGVALGFALTRLARWLQLPSRRGLIVGAAMLSIVTVLAQHAWLYWEFRQGWRDAREKNAQVALFRPEAPWTPKEYFAHEVQSGSIPYWCLDAVLIVVSTLATIRLIPCNVTCQNNSSGPPTSDP
jgi:hypothetical protein